MRRLEIRISGIRLQVPHVVLVQMDSPLDVWTGLDMENRCLLAIPKKGSSTSYTVLTQKDA